MKDNPILLRILRIVGIAIAVIGALYIIAATIILFIPGSQRVFAFEIQRIFSEFIPFILRGSFVYALPFGGGLRGDFILYGVILIFLGKFLRRATRN